MVSEVMSQQTQVSRVIPKYHAFLHVAPTLQDLAKLDRQTLLELWVGLWFNSRALRLQQSAKDICEKHNNIVPTDYKTLLILPWIWPYTAAAICAFAYNQDTPVVDINIKRVLITELNLEKKISDADLRQIAFLCIPSWQSRLWHNALMDYWALVHTAKTTWIRSAPQSRFEWSDREVRWWIMKQLVKQSSVDIILVQTQFQKKEIKKIYAIITKMQKDQLISSNSLETWVITHA